jgi:hypothetical protein
MPTSESNESVLDEKIWNAWVEKGRVRDRAAARQGKIVGGIIVSIVSVGMGVYFLAMR